MTYHSKYKFRWFLVGILSIQLALINILLLFSVRSVWTLINKAIGLGENSLLVILSLLLVLLVTSVSLLLFKTKKQSYGKNAICLFILQILIHFIILSLLYPDLVSMYLSQLPFWLLKEKVLILYILISFLAISGFLVRFNKKKDTVFKLLGIVNGILFISVLSIAYMALTVRNSDFKTNSLENKLKISKKVFTIDTRNTNRFDIFSTNTIRPGISIPLNIESGGSYISAGDLTGDGIVEVITLKYWVEPIDVNRIKSVAVQSMLVDSVSGKRGKTLWTWESEYEAPANIGIGRGSSAAIAVFDLETGQANKKLLMATNEWLHEFTFKEDGSVSEKKVPTGTGSNFDCLTIANLNGTGKHHLLLKDAYHTIWAYDKNLNLLWKTRNPAGYLLAHRIATLDLNEDGKDEIIAGATILNNSGNVITVLKTSSVKLWYGGHIDGIVPIKQNGEWNIGVTYCDGLGLALYDADGNLKWEVTGEHFEYLVGGYFFNNPQLKEEFQLISKVHYQEGDPQIMVNQDGKLLGSFNPSSTVFSVDWTGDGFHEMVFLSPASIYSGTKKITDLHIPENIKGEAHTMRVADMIGKKDLLPDGIPDIAVRTVNKKNKHFLHIYPNTNGKRPTNYVYPGIGWESSANYFTKYYEYNRNPKN